jgi:hypothetical protein
MLRVTVPVIAGASSARCYGMSGHVRLAAPTTAGTDPLWDHNARTWLTDMVVLLLLGLGFAVITWWRLITMGPVKRR